MRLRTYALAAALIYAAGVMLVPASAQAPRPQQPPAAAQKPPAPAQQPEAEPAPAPVKPYKALAITLPKADSDPALEEFRKQLAAIAERKDRAALGKLVVAKGFFWMRDDRDVADKKRSGMDNFARALGLAAKDGSGWDILASFAADPTAAPDRDRKEAICSPADPVFDEKEADALIEETKTDPAEWVFPVSDGVEVRAEGKADAPVVEKLGMHFVRVLPEDESINSDESEFVKVALPSGKTGFIALDSVAPLGTDQLCFVKEAGGWRIGGFVGEGASR